MGAFCSRAAGEYSTEYKIVSPRAATSRPRFTGADSTKAPSAQHDTIKTPVAAKRTEEQNIDKVKKIEALTSAMPPSGSFVEQTEAAGSDTTLPELELETGHSKSKKSRRHRKAKKKRKHHRSKDEDDPDEFRAEEFDDDFDDIPERYEARHPKLAHSTSDETKHGLHDNDAVHEMEAEKAEKTGKNENDATCSLQDRQRQVDFARSGVASDLSDDERSYEARQKQGGVARAHSVGVRRTCSAEEKYGLYNNEALDEMKAERDASYLYQVKMKQLGDAQSAAALEIMSDDSEDASYYHQTRKKQPRVAPSTADGVAGVPSDEDKYGLYNNEALEEMKAEKEHEDASYVHQARQRRFSLATQPTVDGDLTKHEDEAESKEDSSYIHTIQEHEQHRPSPSARSPPSLKKKKKKKKKRHDSRGDFDDDGLTDEPGEPFAGDAVGGHKRHDATEHHSRRHGRKKKYITADTRTDEDVVKHFDKFFDGALIGGSVADLRVNRVASFDSV